MTMVDRLTSLDLSVNKNISFVTLLCLLYDDMIAFDFCVFLQFTSSAIWDSLPDFQILDTTEIYHGKGWLGEFA